MDSRKESGLWELLLESMGRLCGKGDKSDPAWDGKSDGVIMWKREGGPGIGEEGHILVWLLTHMCQGSLTPFHTGE